MWRSAAFASHTRVEARTWRAICHMGPCHHDIKFIDLGADFPKLVHGYDPCAQADVAYEKRIVCLPRFLHECCPRAVRTEADLSEVHPPPPWDDTPKQTASIPLSPPAEAY